MNAFALATDLTERGFDLTRTPDGRLIVRPASLLTEGDRQAVAQHRDALLRLVSSDYSDMTDGWQLCPALPSRAVHIIGGRLTESICFAYPAHAAAFVGTATLSETTP
ncbi:MAG: hypothetical protein FNT29_10345 [Halothiobacillaceae bacterium]|nr:MAG: hypothetical protein FNT29_10345 [Halothiobacillaceae bacterium]